MCARIVVHACVLSLTRAYISSMLGTPEATIGLGNGGEFGTHRHGECVGDERAYAFCITSHELA